MTYRLETTTYDEDEATYDSVDFPHQIINHAGTENEVLVGIFAEKNEAEHVMKLLEASPIPEPTGERIL